MKVLLLNPVSERALSVDPVISRHVGGRIKVGAYFPLGLAYVASMLKKHGIQCDILDPAPQGVSYEDALKKASEFDVIIASLAPENETDMFAFFERLPGKLCAFTGTYATYIADEILANGHCDVVIRGEPELTAVDLVNNITDLAAVKGISYRDENGVHRNADRPRINALDELPFPDRDLLDNSIYTHLTFPGQPVGLILTSRGCSAACTFCATHLFYGRSWRYRSPVNVVDEMEEMATKYNLRHIIVMDDTFTLSPKRVLQICNLILERKLKIEWSCLARPDPSITKELLLAMKKAGCVEVRYGVESGSQTILDNIEKGLTIPDIERAVSLTKKAGIRQLLFFMLGNPGENHATIQQTIDFAKKLGPNFASFTITTPYPGTPMYEQLVHGAERPTKRYDETLTACSLSIAELQKELKRAYVSYYARPHYVLIVLKDFLNNFFSIPRVTRTYISAFSGVFH